MPDPDGLQHLADTLNQADRDRAVDLAQTEHMGAAELDYLSRLDEIEDPATDGVESDRCI